MTSPLFFRRTRRAFWRGGLELWRGPEDKMNQSKIEWCDRTWNPIVGCTHGCGFCYARRQARRQRQNCELCYRFTPHLHPERLKQPAQARQASIVFCGSMGDLFDPEVQPEWRGRVYDAMLRANRHRYVVLTKRPDLIDIEFDRRWPYELWLGVSVTGDEDWWRVERLIAIKRELGCHALISFEPLLGPITHPIPHEVEWVIIGAQTGPGAVAPKLEWIENLEIAAPRFEKDNLLPTLRKTPLCQEWPKTLAQVTQGKAAAWRDRDGIASDEDEGGVE